MPGRLSMMVNDLEEVMLAVFEDHENTFFLQEDLNKVDQVRMIKLGT
jgi:hypothetical protein